MNELRTQISWMLHNHCTSECSYCPIHARGGDVPKGVLEYVVVTQKIIDHYNSLGRKLNWSFNGGEPLDMFDFPMILKLCKENDGTINLTSNGGKLWLDWWAIAPNIDNLNLSYHYWQNPNLIKFIIQSFQKSQKHINVTVPIRPDHFDEDLERALLIESEFGMVVGKSILYKEAEPRAGMFPYSDQQLRIMRGESLVQENKIFKETTHIERTETMIASNPSYTGMLCNTGIEMLTISHDGWVSGSGCNDRYLGNIWKEDFYLPSDPHVCSKMVCIHTGDQKITKFSR